jgi:hypothetical protein
MYDSTHPVEKIKPFEDLFRNLLTEAQRNSFEVIAFDDFKQIAAEYLEDHAEMIAIDGLVYESIEHSYHMRIISTSSPLFTVASFLDLLENLHLVEGCFHIVR